MIFAFPQDGGMLQMHMRTKKWARPELAACPYYDDFPEHRRNHWREAFPMDHPLEVDLGCGKGISTAQMVHENPDVNYLAIDISSDILGDARRNIEQAAEGQPVQNVHVVKCDIEYIQRYLGPDDSVRKIWISFCNPWPKLRHEKRRLTHPRQLMQYRDFLVPGGEIWFKTDDDDLFRDSLLYFDVCGFSQVFLTYDLHASGFAPNYITEHEKKYTQKGIPIKFCIVRKEDRTLDLDPVHWIRQQAFPQNI